MIAGDATTAPPTPAPGGEPTFTPDLPDLTVESVTSRNNQLVVVIANVGAGDVNATMFVTVNGGARETVGAKAGEPLRAGTRSSSCCRTSTSSDVRSRA